MSRHHQEILDEYKRTKSPFKVAQMYSLDVKRVWEIIEANQDYLKSPPEKFGGKGPPELRDHIVARRRIRGPKWDNDEPAIALARDMYEQGRVELCSGRDGSWEILYAIPRKKIKPRPGYWKVHPVR